MKRLTYLLDGNFLPNLGYNWYQQMENSFIIYKSDFLRRNQNYREAYLKSSEAGTQKLCKLKIWVYGLCDAPHVRYLSLKSVLKKCGAKKSKFDHSAFFLHSNMHKGILCLLVDDFCWRGAGRFQSKIIKMIRVFSNQSRGVKLIYPWSW